MTRRLAGIAAALLLAAGLAVAPPSAAPALAAGPLRLQGDAVYTLDPPAGRVHVAIDFKVTNLKANTATAIYYYRNIYAGIQPDVRAVKARDRSGALTVTTKQRTGYTEVNVRLRSNLYYGQSASFTITYDLVGGEPRSDSFIRVGAAFASFGVWAWGDAGRGSVEVRTPPGFAAELSGDPMTISHTADGQVIRAEPADPGTFYAYLSAEDRTAYDETRLSLPGAVEVVVRAWPEDEVWRDTVTGTLRAGLPELAALIGLAWPVEHDLTVRERFTPALEGYAGIFFTDTQRIDVSEDLDPITILHEASHAWFNDDLFQERWIQEGLAEAYSWRVQQAIGGEPGDAAVEPSADDPGFVRLESWTFPQAIRDEETDDREHYGYGAAFWVIDTITDIAGVEQMRAAFAAADGDLTAYPGAPAPETVASRDGWKRLLDLVEPPDQPDPDAIEQALVDWVLSPGEERVLTARREARDAYRAVLAAGDGWLPPWYVRQPMGEWRFSDATRRIEAATAVLDLRDRVALAAAAEGLTPTDALRTAYEEADGGFDPATALGNAELAAIAAVAEAHAKVDEEPDLIAQIGLLGETPRVPYDQARAAFDAGDLEAATSLAAAAVAIIVGAPAVGQDRITIAIAVTVGVLAFLVLLVVLLVRRRRGQRLALAAAAAAGTGDAAVEAARGAAEPDASGTLGAPEAFPPLPGAGPPAVEGGPDRGALPPDS